MHDCDHEDHIHNVSEDSSSDESNDITFEADDCFACDYALSSFAIHHYAEPTIGAHYFHNKETSSVSGSLGGFTAVHSLRGPPSIELS